MSNKPILVLKQIAPPAQQFQSIGADRTPSFVDLARTAFAPRGQVKVLPRVASLAGMAGKGAAAAATALQTAHQLQGGNLAAPLGAQYTYEGYDPSRAVSRVVNPVIDERNQGREAARQESERLLAQRNQRETAQRRALGPQQITTSTAPTNVPLPTATGLHPINEPAPTTAPATTSPSTMSPQEQAGTAMSGNLPQQTGPMMPTQAPPAGVNQSVVGETAERLAQTTGRPMGTPGGPAVPQQTPGVQTQLPIRPSGPQGALPPNMSSAAQQRGPPPAQQSMVSVLPPMSQSPSAHSTANPMTLAQANALMGQNITGGPKSFGVGVNQQSFGDLADWGKDQSLGGQYSEQFSQYGQDKNTNRGIGDQVYWQEMLKAYISYLYSNMGSYLYKMTPHEAGIFAVDTFFKMRE